MGKVRVFVPQIGRRWFDSSLGLLFFLLLLVEQKNNVSILSAIEIGRR